MIYLDPNLRYFDQKKNDIFFDLWTKIQIPHFQAPERATFHRPQHLQIVRESVGDVDVSNGLRVEDPVPVGKVALLQQKQSGIGGERLNYVAQDEWDPRKSTEERLGWSEHKLHDLSIREIATGRDAQGLPNWVRLQKQVK